MEEDKLEEERGFYFIKQSNIVFLESECLKGMITLVFFANQEEGYYM